jgi:hypothetical protein
VYGSWLYVLNDELEFSTGISDLAVLKIRLSASVLTIAMLSYLAMATGFGIERIPIKNTRADAATVILIRSVYIARFVDWLFVCLSYPLRLDHPNIAHFFGNLGWSIPRINPPHNLC